MTCSQSTLLSQSTLSESEDDDALEIEPETLQLQQHRFSTLSQAIASLEPTPISARTACGIPPQNTSSNFSSDGGGPAKSRGPVVPWAHWSFHTVV